MWKKNAFIEGNLEEEVYMDLPLGFEDLSNNEVCRLKKPLFGLKQSLKAWFKRFRKLLKKYSFIQSQGDHTLFINHPSLEKITTLIVYEYDIIDTGDDIEKIKMWNIF